jgi:ABC-type transport system involved in multi-copper enzyme maturation permease subunit
MNDIAGSVAGELVKQRRRPAVWILGACWIVQIVLFAYVVPFIIAQVGPNGMAASDRAVLLAKLLPDKFDLATAASFPLFGSVVMLILGALLTGNEYRWGTWSTILTQGPSRLAVLLGKFLSSGISVAIIVVASFVAAIIISGILGAATNRTLAAPPIGRLGLSLLVAILISWTWASVGMFLGIIFKGSTPAVAVGVIYALAFENIISSLASLSKIVSPLRDLLLGVNGGSLVAALGAPTTAVRDGTPGVVSVVGGTHAVVFLLAYMVAAFALSVVLLRRRDIA